MIYVPRQSPWRAAIIALTVLLVSARSYAQVTVQVVAQPRISASAQCRADDGDCLVQGLLEDELGNPLPNQQLKLTVVPAGIRPSNARLRLKPCDDYESPPDTDQTVSLRTNEEAKYCIRIQGGLSAPDASISISFDGAPGYESATATISLNSALPAPTLTILEGPSRVALEAKSTSAVVQLSAQGRPTRGLPISLELLEPASRGDKNQEKAIARATTDADGVARFDISSKSLGSAGPAQLRAQFAGSNILRPASVAWPILKTCLVQLQPRLDHVSAQVGDSIALDVSAACALRSLSEGSLEISVNGKNQAALPLVDGHVRWRLSTFELSPGQYPLSVRYMPASAGFIAPATQSLVLQLTPTSSQRRALWLVSGGLVFLWFAWRWLGGYTRARAAAPTSRKEIKPQSLEVEPSTTPEFGWIGAVFDSHTGAPIEGAEVTVLVPSFEEVNRELDVVTSHDGSFQLAHRALPAQSRLSVGAPGYLTAKWPMPRPGKLMVCIETRRRAIVRTFVQWAQRVLLRSGSAPEPTPAEVKAIAEQRSLSDVGNWASRVERAAFGPDGASAEDDAILSPPENAVLGHKPPR